MSSSKSIVDLRNIGTIGGTKFKKGVDEYVKLSLDKIKKGESTLAKEISICNYKIERETTREYVELFKQIKEQLKKKYISPRSKKSSFKSLKKTLTK
jgi:hypothetical protein